MMKENRYALLIGNGSFLNHQELNLRCTKNDVSALGDIFRDRDKGAFDEVIELHDKDSRSIKVQIFRMLKKAGKDDLLLIYFTGHGKLNRASKLHLVAADTDYEELEPTSIAASEIIEYIKSSNCKKIGLILDCCYAGAFINGMVAKGAHEQVDAQLNQISGFGVRVMTASTAIQTASERDGDVNSLLTKYLIEGIISGEADRKPRGHIAFGDLFHYAREKVVAIGGQEPTVTELDGRDELIISFNGRDSRKIRAVEITNKLYSLATNDNIPKKIISEAGIVLDKKINELSDIQKRYDKLLDELHSEKLNVANFIYEWGAISQKIDSNSAPSPIDTNRKKPFFKLNQKYTRFIAVSLSAFCLSFFSIWLLTAIYNKWDDDPDRGAVAFDNGAFGESYSTPVYLKDQGWVASDSLWFYNVSQGSNLLPYDFFLSLEVADSRLLFRDAKVFDQYRFLPQKPTFFNPDGLAVGFVKDQFQEKSFIGFSCAACHTGQINYNGKAIRIDGGSAMADYAGYLQELYLSLNETLSNPERNLRFVASVLEKKNDYTDSESINLDLAKYTRKLLNHLQVNRSGVAPGYSRVDMLGYTYNKIHQLILPANEIERALLSAKDQSGNLMLSRSQVNLVLSNLIGAAPLNDQQYGVLFQRLKSSEAGYPGLNDTDITQIKDSILPPTEAPVSIPALWGASRSDFLMWNGRSENSGIGPLVRNTEKSLATFATLNSHTESDGFGVTSFLTGQNFEDGLALKLLSSIDYTNLSKIESSLGSLFAPSWPQDILGKIDPDKAREGRRIFYDQCANCHEVMHNRSMGFIKAEMYDITVIGTDPGSAISPLSKGYSGIFRNTVQKSERGNIRLGRVADSPLLTTATIKVLLTTPDPDKWFVRRWYEFMSAIFSSLFQEVVTPVISESTAAYKAPPLNGIWATAPYLHNGSIPNLYDLFLFPKDYGRPVDLQFRPDKFIIGSREFDPIKVGFRDSEYNGFIYDTSKRGNSNKGHLFGTDLNETDRLNLIEFLKTL